MSTTTPTREERIALAKTMDREARRAQAARYRDLHAEIFSMDAKVARRAAARRARAARADADFAAFQAQIARKAAR